MSIGTFNEGPLHQALKNIYAIDGAKLEQQVDGFVADVLIGDRIVEIQTGSFHPLKTKLRQLLTTHCVTLVYPIPVLRILVKQNPDGTVQKRQSPKKGSFYDLFDELIFIPDLLNASRFQIDVVYTCEEEIRCFDGQRGRRKRGWVVVARHLIKIEDRKVIRSMSDMFEPLKSKIPESFTTKDLSDAMKSPRRVGQKAAYCFRKAGIVEICGKQGNSLVYRRVA